MGFLLALLCVVTFIILSLSTWSPLLITAAADAEQEDAMNNSHRVLGECGTGNPIDDCWRCDPKWADNRTALAGCAVGFGSRATGGKGGEVYVVTDDGDDPEKPAKGTLRHAAMQEKPLWITFERDMTIRPKQDLLVASDKTIDGRGADVTVGDGAACFMVYNASNVIIHGLTIRNCKPSRLITSPGSAGDMSDGDGIAVLRSTDVWIDHCTLSACKDGLIDVTDASTNVTLSNNHFKDHNKTILLGHRDDAPDDKDMKVTVAYNRFGTGLVQRMPRCRFGLFHVINNDYIKWKMYAIGGSSAPTILSHGNRFLAGEVKEVTKREGPESEWKNWNWISEEDEMLNGAVFKSSGSSKPEMKAPSFAKPADAVEKMTASAGILKCKKGSLC